MPTCFGKYSQSSKFCSEVCIHASACGGPEVSKENITKLERKQGKLTFKEMIEKRWDIIIKGWPPEASRQPELKEKVEEIKIYGGEKETT